MKNAKTVMRIFVWLMLIPIIFGSFLTPAFADPGSLTEKVKIGVVLPLSGDLEAFGTSCKNALDLLAQEQNKKGGILGKQVVFIYKDDENDPLKTVSAANQLIDENNVISIIGSVSTKCSLALGSVALEKKIPIIVPASTNMKITTSGGEYVYRTCYNDAEQGALMARFAWSGLLAKRAAVLYNVDEDYSRITAEGFMKSFQDMGGTIAIQADYKTGTQGFGAQLKELKSKKVDIIVLPDNYNTSALIAAEAKKMGISVPFLGGDGWDSSEIYGLSNGALEGSYFINHFSEFDPISDREGFCSNYDYEYGAKPDTVAALTYEAGQILMDALSRAGNTESDKIKNALAVTDFQGLTGRITFDKERNAKKTAVAYNFTDGYTYYTGRIDPDNQGIKTRQELNINLYSEPETLDFQSCYYRNDMQFANWIMEGLTRKMPDGKVVPGAAEKWEVSPDGKLWTFHLRESVWTDNVKVKAKDFSYGWFRAIDPANPKVFSDTLFNIKNAKAYSEGKAKAADVGIKVLDDKTLQVTLAKPDPDFAYLLTTPVYTPVRKDVYEKTGYNYNKEAEYFVTNGPFKIEYWKHGSNISLVKNMDYWNNSAIKLEHVNGLMIKDEITEMFMFRLGQLDHTLSFGAEYKSSLLKEESKRYLDGSVWYLEFNCKNKILKNANVRKALTLAVNRKAIPLKMEKYSWVPAMALVEPDFVKDADGGAFRDKKQAFFMDSDVKNAKVLLSQGMKELGLKKLPTLELLMGDDEEDQKLARYFCSQWQKNLGLKVKIKTVYSDEWTSKERKRDYQITFGGWRVGNPSPLGILEFYMSRSEYNLTGYSNPKYDSLITAIKSEADLSRKYLLMHQAEQMLMNDMPVGPLYFRYKEYALKKYVRDFYRDPVYPDIDLVYSYIDGI